MEIICNDPKLFIEYSHDMQDVHENIEEYNAGKEHKGLIVFDNMIAVMISNNKLNPIVTELFIRGTKPGEQLGRWGGGRPPLRFFRNKKNVLILEKKALIVYPYVKFSIQNVVLRVSKRKNFNFFSFGVFFSGIFDEM